MADDRYRFRVTKTHGALYGVARAAKRRRCDGHMASERHWIEVGDRYVASALPPDHPEVGNVGWWHHNFCMECAPIEYADRCTCPTDSDIDAALAAVNDRLHKGDRP